MFKIVLLGLVISQGAILVAMDKKPESPRSPRRNLLSYSAELLRKSNDALGKKTAAILISTPKGTEKSDGGVYYKYPGSHSPVESWVPYYDYGNEKSSPWSSDCP